MTTEALDGPHYTEEALSKIDQLLNQIEQPSRVFIENNNIGGMLIAEQLNLNDREARLHTGGVENYKFNKRPLTGDDWPTRSISWKDADNRYYHLEIYPEKDLDLVIWSTVNLDYAGLREGRTFEQKEPINLPMPETDFSQLLQTKYDLLHLEAAKLKPR